VLTDTEIVVKRKGGKVWIVLAGPGVDMMREDYHVIGHQIAAG
jgi:hypothetical protein